mgnify:CR=1 FL=1
MQTSEEVNFRPDPYLSPWAFKDSDKPKTTAITGGYQKHSQGSIYYNRKVPSNFEAGNTKSDMLMHSLIDEYSIEGKDKTTKTPNGHYYIDKHGMEMVSAAAMK